MSGNSTQGKGPNDSDYTVESMPTTEAGFVAMRDRMATDPHGAAVCFAVALILYADNKELGTVALCRMIDRQWLDNSGEVPTLRGMDRDKLERYVAKAPNAVHSLVRSATPDNGYEMGSAPYTIRIREQQGDVKADSAKIFVFSTGADTPRPLTMKKNDAGLWKIAEWSSLIVGVRKPVTADGDNY